VTGSPVKKEKKKTPQYIIFFKEESKGSYIPPSLKIV
jgi:hypothetical protein